jgi:hypothetical protein
MLFKRGHAVHHSGGKAPVAKQSATRPFTSDDDNYMARRDRSYSPDSSNKRVRPSHRSPRSPSPTRRSQRPDNRDRDRDWDRDRRDRDKDRDRDRYRDDRHRDDRRRDSYKDSGRDDRRRSRSRERRDRDRRPASPNHPVTHPVDKVENGTARASPTPGSGAATPGPEDEKLKAKRAKLEAWKKEREAKKALDSAKAKAMALAGKSAAPSELTSTHNRTPTFHTTWSFSSILLTARETSCGPESLSIRWSRSQRPTDQG